MVLPDSTPPFIRITNLMRQQKAAEAFECDTKDLTPFEINDPFNDDLPLKGFMCRIRDYRYGALYLIHVCDFSESQAIWGLLKLHYPFDKKKIKKDLQNRKISVKMEMLTEDAICYQNN